MKITQLALYPADMFDMLPLYHWQHTTTRHIKKTGEDKVYQDGKRPIHAAWMKRTYKRADVLQRAKEDRGNVGIKLRPDQCVVDVDTRANGLEGLEKLLTELDLKKEFARAPMVRTGGGGYHFYFKKPPYAVFDTLEGVEGVEFKSFGRQVVAAGSKHPSGKHYVWDKSEGRAQIEDLKELPMIPATLFKMIRKVAKTQEAVEGGVYDQEKIANILAKIDPQEFDSNKKWLELMMAVHHASAGAARYEWIEWSTSDPNYADDAEIIGRRWDSLNHNREGGVTYRTLEKIMQSRNLHNLLEAPSLPDDEFKSEDLDDQYRASNDSESAEQFDFETPSYLRWDNNNLAAMLDYAQFMLSDPSVGFYQMDGRLVTVQAARTGDGEFTSGQWHPSDNPLVQDITDYRLLESINEKVVFKQIVGSGVKQKLTRYHPTISFARHLLARSDRWSFPHLAGVIHSPTIRRDGSLLIDPGYDEVSGLFLVSQAQFPNFLDFPKRDDAELALKDLVALLAGFPFETPADLSAALSMILTALARRSLTTAPMHAVSAPTMATGKTRLVDVAAILSTGSPATVMSQGSGEEEDKKRYLSLLRSSTSIIVIDNVMRPIESASLSSILTQARWQDRQLGANTMMSVSTNAMFCATGNNLKFKGDMRTRALVCRLDAKVERPESRSFSTNLRQVVSENRPQLVTAGLTALRAFIMAKRPGIDRLTPFGRFEEWSNLVRGCLVWLGFADPCDTRERITADDPDRAGWAHFLASAHEMHTGRFFTANALLTDPSYSDLRDAAEALVHRSATSKSLGNYLASKADQIIDGLVLRARFNKSLKYNEYTVEYEF